MNSFVRFCHVARRPATIVVFLTISVDLLSSGRVKLLLRQWNWILPTIVLFNLLVVIVDSVSRKPISKDSAHVR
jgi:hypothetical protein